MITTTVWESLKVKSHKLTTREGPREGLRNWPREEPREVRVYYLCKKLTSYDLIPSLPFLIEIWCFRFGTLIFTLLVSIVLTSDRAKQKSSFFAQILRCKTFLDMRLYWHWGFKSKFLNFYLMRLVFHEYFFSLCKLFVSKLFKYVLSVTCNWMASNEDC